MYLYFDSIPLVYIYNLILNGWSYFGFFIITAAVSLVI